MSWLNVPHQQQTEASWCLPACVSMVSAHLEHPLLQDDVARWLDATPIGVPANRIKRLERRGFEVIYRSGSLADVEYWVNNGAPCILFLRTGDLPHWQVDTPHAVVLVGFEGEEALLMDPARSFGPDRVSVGDLLLAWSHFDYAFAVIKVSII